MYKQTIIPTVENHIVVIPDKWYGQTVEVVVYPIVHSQQTQTDVALQQKRLALDALLDQHLLDLSTFKFNRDEANNYD